MKLERSINSGKNRVKGLVFYFLGALIFVFLLSCEQSKINDESNNNSKLNSFNWKVSSVKDDSTLNASDLKGKVAVIHFFASWCPPCRQEFPEFIKWLKTNSKKDYLVIVPISLDKSKSAADEFFGQSEQEALCYFDKGDAASAFAIRGIPATIILDKSGNIAFKREGSVDWANGEVDEVIEKIKDK